MELLLINQSKLFIIIFIPFIVGFVILLLNYLVAPSGPNIEKLSAYECGFSPFGNARMHFHVHYYLVAIFFLIFDLEIIFLLPWAFTFLGLSYLGTVYAFVFLGFLGLGFFYEWKTGALDW